MYKRQRVLRASRNQDHRHHADELGEHQDVIESGGKQRVQDNNLVFAQLVGMVSVIDVYKRQASCRKGQSQPQ